MSIAGDVESTSSSLPSSAPGSTPGSPRSRAKFLCSYAGKILPRPADAHLKYVGGETRVVSVPRNITFQDLMRKLSSLIEGEVVLKYQLMPEDLDALVTVKSDEDLRHMFDEYDRNEIMGTPRLRTFLFPANPIVIENQMGVGPMDRHSLEQRYINSVNGILFNPIPTSKPQPTFSISTSPRTPPDTITMTPPPPELINPDISGLRPKLNAMPRAHSSPNLCNMGANSPKNPPLTSTLNLGLTSHQYPYHHLNRQPPLHHLNPYPYPYHHPPPLPSPKPPLDHRNSGPRSNDYYNHPYTRPTTRGAHVVYQRPSPNYAYDEYYANTRYDRESPPGSPLAPSPHQNNYVSKWDSLGPRT